MPIIDENEFTPPVKSDPATNAAEITPDDSEDLAYVTRGLMVAGAGALRVQMLGGQIVTLAVTQSAVYPLRVRRVHATGTTASGIVGLW